MRGGVVAAAVALMIIGLFFISFLGTMWGSQDVGRGGIAGFFIPQLVGIGLLFLGFVLLIAGLAASPTERQVIRRQPTVIRSVPATPRVETRILAICPKCKNRIPSSSKFCPECGADIRGGPADVEKEEKKTPLPSSKEKKQTLPRKPEENIIYCIYCGEKLPSDSLFCLKCGKKIE